MPKSIKNLRRERTLTAANPYSGGVAVVTKSSEIDAVDSNSSVIGMSRGQRKRTERKQQVYQKLGKWEAPILNARKQKALKEHDRDSGMLSDFEKTLKSEVSGANIKPASISQVTSNKMKKEIAMREAERMHAVLEHPAFKANPFAAVHMHIQQMLALKSSSSASGSDGKVAIMEVSAGNVDPPIKRSASHEKRMRQKANKSKMDI